MDLSHRQFEERCRALYPALYRQVFWIVGDRDLTEDVLQEALVRGYQARAQLRDWNRLEGWLYRIAVREAMSALRARKIQYGQSEAVEESLPSGRPDPAEEMERVEQQRALWLQLEELSPRQRTAFILCAVEECGIREAAGRMGVSSGAVKRHLSRARAKLRRKLARYFDGDDR
jgi:RNA polymerase sigma-70 factor (ECF subfamily)